ncbi:MAG: leucyl aminopeptidase [Microbacteriaceae bacterium]|nr:leucyl aminopeptidase [Microbacteriaceae bacterium]
MTVPSLHLSSESALEVVADVLAIAVRATPDGPVLLGVSAEFSAITATLTAIGFTGTRDEVRRIPAVVGACSAIALVGLGTAEPDSFALSYAAGSVTRQLNGVSSIAIAFPVHTMSDAAAVLQGAAAGAYAFTRYRSGNTKSGNASGGNASGSKQPANTITVLAPSESTETGTTTETVQRATAIATAIHTVRDLVNTPPLDLFPESFAEQAQQLAADLPIAVTIFAETELEEGGFGGIIGVGQGSPRGPRLVKLSYLPEHTGAHLALVGKGITFDTGGLSLKPAASMVGMKYDMTGAATALAVVIAAASLRLPLRLTAWLCLAENMPSGTAIRPNDVLTMRGGTTVEVLNTDAEGRLVLADGLVAASEEFPDAIIDIATLTGAASVAMGNRYVPVMGDSGLVGLLVAASDRVGEPFWAMPLPGELRALLDSDIADIANVKMGHTAGGMMIAGCFLREFIGSSPVTGARIPWAHLDIAGAANNAGPGYGSIGKGPTGVAVRTLLELAEEFSRE